MFESDDYDQVLSQIDLPDQVLSTTINTPLKQYADGACSENFVQSIIPCVTVIKPSEISNENFNRNCSNLTNEESTQHTKRKIIKSHFDHKSKRKFPGPAGLLTGVKDETGDEQIYQIELLSQDIDYSHNYISDVFETSLWKRLLEDTINCVGINSINSIKKQALAGHLQRKKAQIVRAFVEGIDRSAVDPLLTLRDATGHIKCTLHRDAWTCFSNYIVSQYCALVIYKPTVLTTGSTFKKHYLNITLSNISTIYSSTTIKDEEQLPDGFTKICENDFTIIKNKTLLGVDHQSSHNSSKPDSRQLLDDLDNIFADVF